MSSVDTVVDVASVGGLDITLAGATRAHGQDQVGVLIADHGAGVVRGVVGSSADGFTGRAVDRNTGRVAGIVLVGRDNLHTTGRERIAVNVGQIIRDLAISPGELELRDRAAGGGIGRQLDGDTDALLAVLLGVAALELLHVGIVVLADGSVVDGESTVVDNGGRANGHDGRSRGKQHGCARDDVLELHFDWLKS